MAAAKFYARFTVLRSNDCVTDEGEPERDQQISDPHRLVGGQC